MTTYKMLAARVDLLNERMGLPAATYTEQEDGKYVANIGRIDLHDMGPDYRPYKYSLEQITSPGGSVTTLNTWQTLMSANECLAFLSGMLKALDLREKP